MYRVCRTALPVCLLTFICPNFVMFYSVKSAGIAATGTAGTIGGKNCLANVVVAFMLPNSPSSSQKRLQCCSRTFVPPSLTQAHANSHTQSFTHSLTHSCTHARTNARMISSQSFDILHALALRGRVSVRLVSGSVSRSGSRLLFGSQ